MKNKTSLIILRKGAPPPCLGPGGVFCRGCPGWPAMRRAAAPGGPWHGAVIHCSCTGLTAKGAEAKDEA